MNVLEISVRSDIGGGPKHLLDLLKEYNNTEIRAFSAIPFSGEYTKEIQSNSLDSFEIPFRGFSLLSFFRLLKFLKKNNIEVVHSHGRGAGIYTRLLKFFGYKVIHTFHGVHIETSLIGKVKLVVDKLLMALTDEFICVSNSEKEDAISNKIAGASNTSVIPNGVFVNPRRDKPQNKIIKLGTLSRLNYQKGLDILIDFVDKYSQKNGINFEVEIAGDGELESELKEKLSRVNAHNIKFVGPTSKPIEFLSNLDGYISFARWEGMPLAVLEAMGVGVPCLLSRVQGNVDLIDDGKDGLLFDLNSYKSFEEKLNIFLSDESKRELMGSIAQKKIQTEFTTQKMAQRTLELYK